MTARDRPFLSRCHKTGPRPLKGNDKLRQTAVTALVTLAAALAPLLASAEPLDRAEARLASNALEDFYREHEVYTGVRCVSKDLDIGAPRTWVKCSGADNVGGLYIAERAEGDAIRVWAVNGRAIQHISKDGATLLDIDMKPIQAEVWKGEAISIQSILKSF